MHQRCPIFFRLFVGVLFGTFHCVPDSFAQLAVEWDQLQPTPRYGHAMCYDSDRGEIVMYGGNVESNPSLETWRSDGMRWSSRPYPCNPPGGTFAAMVYDTARRVIVNFGGIVPNILHNQTWEGTVQGWNRRDVAGPVGRFSHAMVYDQNRGVTVLFGGYGPGSGSYAPRSDTWEWDGSTWTERQVAGPSARGAHVLVYDPIRGVTVLHGGSSGTNVFLQDTWEYDGTAWTPRGTTGPSVRGGSAACYDGVRHEVVLFGGYMQTASGIFTNAETWVWNGTAWIQRSTTGPAPRLYSRMVYDPAASAPVLHGGYGVVSPDVASYYYYDDVWEWNGTMWNLRRPPGPGRRSGHAMAQDTARGRTVLFGGSSATASITNETWEWDGVSWMNRQVAGPSLRSSAAMAYDSTRHVTVLYGGSPNGAAETWEWNGTNWTQRSVVGPLGRESHAMAYDSVRGVTVLYGGRNSSLQIPTDTWEWDGNTWSRRATTGPAGFVGASMVFDSIRGVCVLFTQTPVGGTSGTVWEWNGTNWTQRAGSTLPLRYDHSMAFDSVRGVSVLSGGMGLSGLLSETWEWNGTSWTRRAIALPALRGVASVFDPARGMVLRVGGDRQFGSTAQMHGLIVTNPGLCRANFDCVNGVAVQDVFAFVNSWFARSSSADINEDGVLSAQDIFDFLSRWFAVC